MREAGWLNSRRTEEQTSELLRKALYGDESGVTKGSRLMGLLEFGRVVHAEMAAITDAARRGISVKGGVLFTTTFPCHICARHIIASGIKRVVYIEPYPKSMAGELYPDSILVDGPSDQNKVQFGSFVGVAPRRFMELFDMPRRKDDFGHAIEWKAATANPRVRRLEHTYVIVELSVMKFLGKAVRKSGLLS
jgi:cytidine deaminase